MNVVVSMVFVSWNLHRYANLGACIWKWVCFGYDEDNKKKPI